MLKSSLVESAIGAMAATAVLLAPAGVAQAATPTAATSTTTVAATYSNTTSSWTGKASVYQRPA